MHRSSQTVLLMLAGFVLAACASATDTATIDTEGSPEIEAVTPSAVATDPGVEDPAPPQADSSATTADTTSDVQTDVDDTDPPPPTSTAAEPPRQNDEPTPEPTNMSTQPEEARCQRLTDFSSADLNQRWSVVNDNVMGGRSLGGLRFDEGVMIFEGQINTDGGGFSSLRFSLEPGALVEHDRIVFRARPDERSYMVTFDDDLASRDRRVSHRSPIELGAPGEWQTVSVSFDDLFPAIFGRPIDDLAFRKDLASRVGLMISDGIDGPFRLEIDWIDVCSP